MRAIMVQGDMLDIRSRLPDNSANFTINGIDTWIIENSAYHQALARELERATVPGGIVFGMNSDAVFYISNESFENKPMTVDDLGVAPFGIKIVEKKIVKQDGI
jgi:hypothetical protein